MGVALFALFLSACTTPATGVPGTSGTGGASGTGGSEGPHAASGSEPAANPYPDDASRLARGAAFVLNLGTSPYPPLVAADAATGTAVVGLQESAEEARILFFDPKGGFRPADSMKGELGWVGLVDVSAAGKAPSLRAAWLSGSFDPDSQSISGPLVLGEARPGDPAASAGHRTLPDCGRFQAVLPAGRTLWTRPVAYAVPYLCGSELHAYNLVKERAATLDSSVPSYGDYVLEMPSPSLRYVAFQTTTDDGGENLIVYDIASGGQAAPFAPDGALDTARWSPDGKVVASLLFRRLPDGTYDAIPGDDGPLDVGSALVLFTPDGKDARQLSTPHHVTSPTWSPDGQAVAMLDVTVSGSGSGVAAAAGLVTHGLWVWRAGGQVPSEPGSAASGAGHALSGASAPSLVWTPADPSLQYDIVAWPDPHAIIIQSWRADPNGEPGVTLLAVDPDGGSSREVGTVDWNGASSAIAAGGGLVFVSGNEVDWWKSGRRTTLLTLGATVNYAEPLAQAGEGVFIRLSTDTRDELVWTPLR